MKSLHQLLVVACATLAFSVHGADAVANWTDQCAKCHGADGKGETKMGKKLGIADLTDAKTQAKFTDADVIKLVKEGAKDAKGATTMKAIEGLTADEITALIPIVRAFGKK